MQFERDGLAIYLSTSFNGNFFTLVLFDNRFISSLTDFARLIINKEDAYQIFISVIAGKYTPANIEIDNVEILIKPSREDFSKVWIVIKNREFLVDYQWLKQVFKRILAEAEALED